VSINPVTGIGKFQETGGRLICLSALEETQEALRDAVHHDEAARLDGVSWHGKTHLGQEAYYEWSGPPHAADPRRLVLPVHG